MTFDLETLMAVEVLATAIAGALVGMAWLSDRTARALAWWAAGYFAIALGVAALLVSHLDPASALMTAGLTLLALGPALIWSGARLLGGKRPPTAAIAAGPLLTLTSLAAQPLLPAIANLIHFGATIAYLTLTVVALWPLRRTGLRSATPLIAFIALHAAVFAIGLIEGLLDLLPQKGLIGFKVLFGAIHFEQLLFAMGSSIFLVALVRERSELQHKTVASIDALTGVGTRRAFIEKARHQLGVCLGNGAPLALIMFDLDGFKRVNDGYGHAAGDQVLQMFAEVARGRLRGNDFIGRLGGEEFAVVMPGSSPSVAGVIAERIRRSFAESGVGINDQNVSATVSGGVAMAEPGMTLEQLLSAADAALYRAKANGRNSIEMADRRDGGRADTSVVIRVA